MVIIPENNLIKIILGHLRNKETPSPDFREFLRLSGMLTTYEILGREFQMNMEQIETPLKKTSVKIFTGEILQVIIMRAGLPFADGGSVLLDKLSFKRTIGIVDARRVEENAHGLDFPIEITSFKVPSPDGKYVIIYDPMLATGATLISVIERLKRMGNPRKIIVNSVISAPYGIKKIEERFPEVIIYTMAMDEEGEFSGLNDKGYIVPGLGDCGDRAFGEY
ncbi:MAG TPA: uracil phosphoribosyltransferase [candidate division WOR-3 bacterium]|uniref:Uracil phosphoribosyltransferase n=1 Tax=candidate division WOR-3 bacterium TaxID=2052148 RepID=A0A7C0ZDQ8_UNCW3|nr:uracil phosphoribosyltransferase [candidate division WOR-3 bacterium]